MANLGDIIEPENSDLLYHGTSIGRWEKIRAGGALVPSEIGDRKIGLTPSL
jgi:hypothetical protein